MNTKRLLSFSQTHGQIPPHLSASNIPAYIHAPHMLLQAVSKLQALDNSFTVIPNPKKVQSKKGCVFYINSVPRELEMNVHDVLDAAGDAGFVTLEQLAARPTWTTRRAELALQAMIKDGTCLIDDGDPRGVRLFWFPSAGSFDT